MKNLHLIVWLTQLGISIAAPLAGFVLLALWLRAQFGWGIWVIFVGLGLGIVGAVDGLRTSLRALEKASRKARQEKEEPTLSFHDHD